MELATDRGVFSPRQIDPGTAVLLKHLDPVPAGTLLDLGCGYGPIAIAVALRQPKATVWAVDVNERALRLARANAEAANATNIVTVLPGDVPAEARFDRIYSNPPIRIGKTALHELLTEWLGRLAPAGLARLVVNRHLGSDSLASWLSAEGHETIRLTSERGYRVLEVAARAAAG